MSEKQLQAAPIGTLAPSYHGGGWRKTKRGWKWGATGSTFPRPGADWNGELIQPLETGEEAHGIGVDHDAP